MGIKKRSGKKYAVAVLGLLVLAASGWFWSVWVRIHENPPPPEGTDPPVVETNPEKNILNVLVLGIDQLKNEPARADSIIVMSLNKDTGEVAMISIPRDARVEIPGRGPDKINHAMAYKGEIALMKRTVESLLGVPIHHYVYTNFAGFINIVDVLGGVSINVERRMVYQDIYYPIRLQPGVQRLTGELALGYVRFRGDSQGDFGRMQRQQEFLKAIAKEVLQVRTVLRLPQLLEQVARYLRTDMTIPQLLSFSRTATGMNMDEVVTVTLQGRNINVNGVAYVALDMEHLEETVERYLRWEEEDVEEVVEEEETPPTRQ
jgi:LCP family protein required for cell wall assembly